MACSAREMNEATIVAGKDAPDIETLTKASSAASSSSEPADEIFLEGPRSRLAEFLTLLRVMRDFLRGFRTLHFVGPCVTVFGSARIKPGDPHYELARKMGAAIARLGFTVITGGGPGIMEAANRGAREAGGRSVGCTIELPSEQPTNVYLDRCVRMHYFFARKTLLVKYSYAFVVMPGGAGTLDELFEALTLIQTGKIKNFPIVIMGTDYWKELLHLSRTSEAKPSSRSDSNPTGAGCHATSLGSVSADWVANHAPIKNPPPQF